MNTGRDEAMLKVMQTAEESKGSAEKTAPQGGLKQWHEALQKWHNDLKQWHSDLHKWHYGN